MNIQVLQYIIKNDPSYIEQAARKKGQDEAAALGIAKQVAANGHLNDLSQAQKFVFNAGVLPLISNVDCNGLFGLDAGGHSTCAGDEKIDDETLLTCYIDDNFLCQICRHSQEELSNLLAKD